MKTLTLIASSLILTACAGTASKPVTLLPWECMSSVEPTDAESRKVGNRYVYSCLWNGDGDSGNDGEGDGE